MFVSCLLATDISSSLLVSIEDTNDEDSLSSNQREILSYKFTNMTSGLLSHVWSLDTNDFVTDRFCYANNGTGGANETCCWAMIGTQNDTGQWTYFPESTGYGIYTWSGKRVTNGNDAGFVIQGLVSKDTRSYIAFESRLRYHVFRTITYRNNLVTETIIDFNLSDTSFHNYSIIWSPGNALFFIDDVLVANHTSRVPDPSSNLYFHTQACLPPSYDDNNMPLYGEMRDVYYSTQVEMML